ncbi:DUF7289 family protein [Natrinema salaciae]|uniref:DUF7305 domain-containing protein n=1 Tax=Natrinema salaciae TaxID=1186196 RepID=A0A1H9S1W8_9EURY|nr:hypothetical protein [Natrinema salaciae]SER78908.1 hypothetical protein SAMN04489841_4547 [Natrinema salaciae]
MKERGVSPVLGLILLIGVVAAASVSLLVVGDEMMDSGQQEIEEQRVQQSFVELSKTISSARTSTDAPKSTTLDAGERGAIAREATGSYNITVENASEIESVGNGTIGTIEYTSEDGTTVAYEAGAVFRETGTKTQVVSQPPFNYDHETNTLTLPVATMTDGKDLSSGDLLVTHETATENAVTHVQNYRVYVEIESEYCRGWETYFEEQAGYSSIEEGCFEGTDGSVTVRLGYDELDNAFSDGVSLPNGEDSITGKDQHNPFDDVAANEFQSLDGTIQAILDDTDSAEFDKVEDVQADPTEELDDGKYYTDGIENEQLSFDLSDGDAMLVVNGSIDTHDNDDGITVSDCGDDNTLRVYVTGDINMDNGGTIGPDCGGNGDETTIQVYGSSDTDVLFAPGNPSFTGLLYAAGGEVDFQGSPDFTGSIIAESVNIDSNLNNVDSVEVDSDEVEVIPSGYEPAPQITYLNVVNHEIDIQNK